MISPKLSSATRRRTTLMLGRWRTGLVPIFLSQGMLGLRGAGPQGLITGRTAAYLIVCPPPTQHRICVHPYCLGSREIGHQGQEACSWCRLARGRTSMVRFLLVYLVTYQRLITGSVILLQCSGGTTST